VRLNAYKEFYTTHNNLFIKPKIHKIYNHEAKPGIDYLQYSRESVLQNANIYINNTEFFDQKHSYMR
jgi:hypothetical protein